MSHNNVPDHQPARFTASGLFFAKGLAVLLRLCKASFSLSTKEIRAVFCTLRPKSDRKPLYLVCVCVRARVRVCVRLRVCIYIFLQSLQSSSRKGLEPLILQGFGALRFF
mgnify:FL=1